MPRPDGKRFYLMLTSVQFQETIKALEERVNKDISNRERAITKHTITKLKEAWSSEQP